MLKAKEEDQIEELSQEPTILMSRSMRRGEEILYPIELINEIEIHAENRKFKLWKLSRDKVNIPISLLYRAIIMGSPVQYVCGFSSGNFTSFLKYVIQFYK